LRRGGISLLLFLSADIMTRVGNHAPLTPIQKSTLRYALEPATAELSIEDFEGMPSLEVSFEIVIGPLPVHEIG